MLAAPIPNEVLDLPTLRVVRAGVAEQPRLITGSFSRRRYFLALFPTGTDYCAVGAASKPEPGHVPAYTWYDENDIDNMTLGTIIKANDSLKDVTPQERQRLMLDWLDRCIAYAVAVKREMEYLASSGSARFTELRADEAEATCADCEYAKSGVEVAA